MLGFVSVKAERQTYTHTHTPLYSITEKLLVITPLCRSSIWAPWHQTWWVQNSAWSRSVFTHAWCCMFVPNIIVDKGDIGNVSPFATALDTTSPVKENNLNRIKYNHIFIDLKAAVSIYCCVCNFLSRCHMNVQCLLPDTAANRKIMFSA